MRAEDLGLTVRGTCAADPAEGFGTGTVVLIGPDEPRFWPMFAESSEFHDGARNPLDRWSARMLGLLADAWGGRAVLPYDGPPWPPFIAWAKRSGAAYSSPVGLLVHGAAGLFLSFRGAVVVDGGWTGEALTTDNPCPTCTAQPCLTACPVGALRAGVDYDVAACKAHLRSPEGAACLEGCLVRRACPVSQRFGRLPAQSAFHMRAFLGE